MSNDNNNGSLLGYIFRTAIAMIGFNIHKSILWSLFDFIFAPYVLIKWLIYHEITKSIIESTFSFLFKS